MVINMLITSMNFTVDGLETLADQLKVLLLGALVNDGLVDQETVDKWAATHTLSKRWMSLPGPVEGLCGLVVSVNVKEDK